MSITGVPFTIICDFYEETDHFKHFILGYSVYSTMRCGIHVVCNYPPCVCVCMNKMHVEISFFL